MKNQLKEVNTKIDNNVILHYKSSDAPFDVEGLFKNWDAKKYPSEIEVKLILSNNQYYHLSKCNFCHKLGVFEIHVEKVDMADSPQNVSFLYKNAKQEKFQFKPLSHKHVYLINILVYNSDPNDPEKYYKLCDDSSKTELDHPKKIGNRISGPQPDTSKGNIIVGNP